MRRLPGKAYSKNKHVWITGANEIDSKIFSRAILAKVLLIIFTQLYNYFSFIYISLINLFFWYTTLQKYLIILSSHNGPHSLNVFNLTSCRLPYRKIAIVTYFIHSKNIFFILFTTLIIVNFYTSIIMMLRLTWSFKNFIHINSFVSIFNYIFNMKNPHGINFHIKQKYPYRMNQL